MSFYSDYQICDICLTIFQNAHLFADHNKRQVRGAFGAKCNWFQVIVLRIAVIRDLSQRSWKCVLIAVVVEASWNTTTALKRSLTTATDLDATRATESRLWLTQMAKQPEDDLLFFEGFHG